jgi:magnesium transporter
MKYTLPANGVTWVHVSEPAPEELAAFIRETQLLPSDAEFIARYHRRPEIITRADYLLLVVSIPVFDKKLRVTTGVVVYFVVRSTDLLSVTFEQLPSLDYLRSSLERSAIAENHYVKDSSLSFALFLITEFYASALPKLERLSNHIEIAEDAVFQGNERKMVEEISLLMRDVLDFRKIIRPQRELFSMVITHPLITPEVSMQWRQIYLQLQRLWGFLENLFESMQELSRTNYTLIQHKENELLRVLMLYSIMSIPILLLVGPYFSPGSPVSTSLDRIVFWVVFGVLLFVLIYIAVHMKRKNIL